MPITTADLLNDRVLPFYQPLGMPVQTVLTNNGREFSGRPEQRLYKLCLALHDTNHPPLTSVHHEPTSSWSE